MPLLNGTQVENLTVPALKSELKKLGLSTEGVKVVLIVRLSKALAGDSTPSCCVQTRGVMSVQNNNPESGDAVDQKTSTTIQGEGQENVENEGLDDSQCLEIVDEPEDEEPEEKNSNGGAGEEPEGEDEFEEEEQDEQSKDTPEDVDKMEDSEAVKAPEEVKKDDVPAAVEAAAEDVKKEEEPEDVQSSEHEITVDESDEQPKLRNSMCQEDEVFLDYEEDLVDENEKDEGVKASEAAGGEAGATGAPEVAEAAPEDTKNEEESGQKQDEKKEGAAPTATTTTTASKPPTKPAGGLLLADESRKTSIWIRGMAPSTKASSVKQLASQYGKVVQAKIFNSRPSHEGEIKNCFALVTFADVAAMDFAITSLQKKNYQGRVLRVEKVSESHLTGSAERIAQEKRQMEEKQKTSESVAATIAPAPEPPKKKQRAQITAPESTTPPPRRPAKPSESTPQNAKKEARQTIQAPTSSDLGEKRQKRPQIQPPERSRSRERRETQRRKPIIYDDELLTERESPERDSRRIIQAATATAPRASRVPVSPIRSSSRQGGGGGRGAEGRESLIISARVDTSNCRGGKGVTIKRSVERSIPNNISTSSLRRNAPPTSSMTSSGSSSSQRPRSGGRPPSPAPRASYQTEQYRERGRADSEAGGRRRHEKSPIREGSRRRDEDHRHYSIEIRGRQQEQEPARRRQHDEQDRKAQEMMALLAKREEEDRIREQRREIEREKERIRLEAEKLERARLELEVQKQKMQLEQQAMALSAGAAGNGRFSREGSSSSSRRRQASDVLAPPTLPKIPHRDDHRSSSRRESERSAPTMSSSSRRAAESRTSGGSRHQAPSSHTTSSSASSRQTPTYGIQSSGIARGTDYSRMMDPPRSGYSSNSNSTTSTNYRGGSSGGYPLNNAAGNQGYQAYGFENNVNYQVWGGLDDHGQMANPDTNWTTGATPSTSSTSSASVGHWNQNQNHYSTSSGGSSSRRDYGYQRNNY